MNARNAQAATPATATRRDGAKSCRRLEGGEATAPERSARSAGRTDALPRVTCGWYWIATNNRTNVAERRPAGMPSRGCGRPAPDSPLRAARKRSSGGFTGLPLLVVSLAPQSSCDSFATALGIYVSTALGSCDAVRRAGAGPDDWARFVVVVAATGVPPAPPRPHRRGGAREVRARLRGGESWGRLRQLFRLALVVQLVGGLLAGMSSPCSLASSDCILGVADLIVPLLVARRSRCSRPPRESPVELSSFASATTFAAGCSPWRWVCG